MSGCGGVGFCQKCTDAFLSSSDLHVHGSYRFIRFWVYALMLNEIGIEIDGAEQMAQVRDISQRVGLRAIRHGLMGHH